MYKQLPAAPSYAQRILINHIDNRRFMSFLRQAQIKESLMRNIYNAALGVITPSYNQIFLLRSVIPPCYWFFTEKEAKPTPVPFHAVYGCAPLEEQHVLVARKIFQLLKEKRKFKVFLRSLQLSETAFIATVNMTNLTSGQAGFRLWRQHPAFHAIQSLKYAIHPDYWYIFTDELDGPFPPLPF